MAEYQTQIEDFIVGSGPAAKAGDTVAVHYTGTLVDGTKFDSSLDRGDPLRFLLGKGQVIQGWDFGVAGMQVGGKRKLIIPSQEAYGPNRLSRPDSTQRDTCFRGRTGRDQLTI